MGTRSSLGFISSQKTWTLTIMRDELEDLIPSSILIAIELQDTKTFYDAGLRPASVLQHCRDYVIQLSCEAHHLHVVVSQRRIGNFTMDSFYLFMPPDTADP
ncbi:hypothetical protein JOB18_002418, partial [Solea senegalensis]